MRDKRKFFCDGNAAFWIALAGFASLMIAVLALPKPTGIPHPDTPAETVCSIVAMYGLSMMAASCVSYWISSMLRQEHMKSTMCAVGDHHYICKDCGKDVREVAEAERDDG